MSIAKPRRLLSKKKLLAAGGFVLVTAVGVPIQSILEQRYSSIEEMISNLWNYQEVRSFRRGVGDFLKADALDDQDGSRQKAELYRQSLLTIKSAADEGIIDAMKFYGRTLCAGRIGYFEPNRSRGLQYLGMAAEKGDIEASIWAQSCN